MYDVAEVAGVSHQTVSRVLHGFEGIRPDTRERVLAAIRETGYRPNLAARMLVTRRSRAIGVLAPASADFGPVSTLQAVEQAIRAAGWQPLVTSTPVDAESVREGLELMLGRSVEALVVIAPYQVVLEEVARLTEELPVIVLQTGEATDVTVDQAEGARLAVRHLAGLGHRRVQLLTGPAEFLESGVRREAAHDELRRGGVAVAPDLAGDWTADSGYALAALLDPEATAVLCANDQMAIGLIHGLADRGLRVPDDVSVVGFDDIPESAHTLPPLTTVHQAFDEVARRAVERVVGQLEHAEARPGSPVPARLVERASTARPRAS
jgi:DNA-binding LacI/PurR family transcriptional regulator